MRITPSSNSSSPDIGVFSKIKYWYALFRMRLRMPSGSETAGPMDREIREIVRKYEHLSGKRAIDCTVLEIGFGARPLRSYGFSAYFNKVIGVDLDHPVLSAGDIFQAWRQNGIERTVKSSFRYIFFERRFLRQFHSEMRKINVNYSPGKARLIVSDVGDESMWQNLGKIDFVFSTDVFEHIPSDVLEKALRIIHDRTDKDAIVVTIPNVFTGITGGHDLKWYPHKVEHNTSEDAWGHLLDESFTVNTYLNRMTRLQYADLFVSTGFSILEDRAVRGRLGDQHLTTENREKLSAFGDYELFSNSVEFSLKKS